MLMISQQQHLALHLMIFLRVITEVPEHKNEYD